jgi:hypothetical protein
MAAKDLMTWMRQVAWIVLVDQVMQKVTTHMLVLCAYGCQDLMTWIGLVAWMDPAAWVT